MIPDFLNKIGLIFLLGKAKLRQLTGQRQSTHQYKFGRVRFFQNPKNRTKRGPPVCISADHRFFFNFNIVDLQTRITSFLIISVFISCSPLRFKMFTQSLNSNYRAPLSTAKERSVPPSLPQTQCRICTIYLNIFQVTESNLPILLFILESFGLMPISFVDQIWAKIEKGDKSKYCIVAKSSIIY